jgi:hypothetical protein
MRASILLPAFCLAANALAYPNNVVARQVTIIEGQIASYFFNVQHMLGNLGDAIVQVTPKMTGDEASKKMTDIKRQYDTVLEVTDGWVVAWVREFKNLAAVQSKELAPGLKDVSSEIESVVEELIKIKPVLKANDRQTILKYLQQHKTIQKRYADGIARQLHPSQKPTLTKADALWQTTLQNGINAYS